MKVDKELNVELFNAKMTISCLKTILMQKGICTEKEIDEIMNAQLIAYKLNGEEECYVASAARWS